MNDADRHVKLRVAKLRALVQTRWELSADATPTSFPSGATLRDPSAGRCFVLIEGDATRRLGGILAVALRAGAEEAHVVVDSPETGAALARRASLVTFPVTVWWADGRDLIAVEPAPAADDPAPAPEAELYRPILQAAGLDPVVEGGHLCGELLGLEVARVVVDEDGQARVESGVGRFDREAGTMVRAGLAEADALQVVTELVAPLRRGDAERHPMNQLVRERWLRKVLIDDPALVGAAQLTAVGSAVARANLTEDGVATAVGVDPDGRPVVVSCSTGVNLDFPLAAADDRFTHAPGARLILVVPARDDAPITRELARLLDPPAEIVTVADDWAGREDGP